MLDANPAHLTRYGEVTIKVGGEIELRGFDGHRTSCRDLAVLAQLYAIRVLTESVEEALSRPGGGRAVICD